MFRLVLRLETLMARTGSCDQDREIGAVTAEQRLDRGANTRRQSGRREPGGRAVKVRLLHNSELHSKKHRGYSSASVALPIVSDTIMARRSASLDDLDQLRHLK